MYQYTRLALDRRVPLSGMCRLVWRCMWKDAADSGYQQTKFEKNLYGFV